MITEELYRAVDRYSKEIIYGIPWPQQYTIGQIKFQYFFIVDYNRENVVEMSKELCCLACSERIQCDPNYVREVLPSSICRNTGIYDDDHNYIFEKDKCEITFTDFYSNPTFSAEPDDTFTGTVKLRNGMFVVEGLGGGFVLLYEVVEDEMKIKILEE